MNGKPVTFTPTEIEGLEQIISAGHKWLDGSNPAYPDLILKLGRAFLDAQGDGTSQELYLSEMEAWYLREIVPSNMRVRGEGIGLAVKKKLYPIILDFEAEKYSSVAGTKYGFSTLDESFSRKDVIIEQEAEEVEAEPESTDDLPEPEDLVDVQPEDVEPSDQDAGDTVDNAEITRSTETSPPTRPAIVPIGSQPTDGPLQPLPECIPGTAQGWKDMGGSYARSPASPPSLWPDYRAPVLPALLPAAPRSRLAVPLP